MGGSSEDKDVLEPKQQWIQHAARWIVGKSRLQVRDWVCDDVQNAGWGEDSLRRNVTFKMLRCAVGFERPVAMWEVERRKARGASQLRELFLKARHDVLISDRVRIDRKKVDGETKARRSGLRSQQRNRGPASRRVGLRYAMTDEIASEVLQEHLLFLRVVL